MARYKPDVNELKTLDDVDRVLKELCALETQVERIDSDGDARIAKIKEETAKAGKAIRERIKELNASVKAFSDYNKQSLFKDKKSIERAFGIIGYRKTPPSISVAKTTVDLLEKLGMTQYIRIRKEPDKEALLSLDDDALAQIDAVRKSKEEFFVQPKRETVNKDLLASA
jgi:phage host-nuclease inhibitor protein Gam